MSDITEFVKQAEKEFGENAAIIIDENKVVDIDIIPTGIGSIDLATGIGGFPRGRISEVFGKEGTGKTTLCLHAIAQAQKLGLNAMFIDAEHALSVERMRTIGVDTGNMVISQPDSGEGALEIAEMAIRSKKFAIIVIDSVAALVPQVEVDKDMGDSVMGVHAKLMSQAMRKLTAPVNKNNVALVFTNQTRSNIGGYGSPEVTTGGVALKFYASLRIKIKYKGEIKEGNQRIAGKYELTVVKNKLAVPFKVVEVEINETGIDDSGVLIETLIDAGILEKSGSWIKLNGEPFAQGSRSASIKLKNDQSLKNKLMQQLQQLHK